MSRLVQDPTSTYNQQGRTFAFDDQPSRPLTVLSRAVISNLEFRKLEGAKTKIGWLLKSQKVAACTGPLFA
ncbi:hypothetical protein B5X24_HaOG204287 [Helicoverpa armigera]|nr:hypothetical protein B5X24_HaOG204287 [Helicoverpa armigera]